MSIREKLKGLKIRRQLGSERAHVAAAVTHAVWPTRKVCVHVDEGLTIRGYIDRESEKMVHIRNSERVTSKDHFDAWLYKHQENASDKLIWWEEEA